MTIVSPSRHLLAKFLTRIDELIIEFEHSKILFNFMNRKFIFAPFHEPYRPGELEVKKAFSKLEWPKIEATVGNKEE